MSRSESSNSFCRIERVVLSNELVRLLNFELIKCQNEYICIWNLYKVYGYIESLQIQRTKNTIVVFLKLKIYNILNAVNRTEEKDRCRIEIVIENGSADREREEEVERNNLKKKHKLVTLFRQRMFFSSIC